MIRLTSGGSRTKKRESEDEGTQAGRPSLYHSQVIGSYGDMQRAARV